MTGTALVRDSRWAEALARFEASWRLVPHAGTAFNLGFCERALGHYTRAHKFFVIALRDHRASGGTLLPSETAMTAETLLDEVSRSLARVEVILQADDLPAALSVDGRPLEMVTSHDGQPVTLAAGTADPGPPRRVPGAKFVLLVDPGPHIFMLTKEGRADTVVNATFAAGAGTIRLVANAPDEPPLSESPPQPSANPVPPAEPRSPSPSGNDTLGYVALGVGAAGLVAGSVLGTIAISRKADLDNLCPDGGCPRSLQDDLDTTGVLADAATIAFVIGGVGVGAGAALLLWPAPSPSAQPSVGLGLTPMGASVFGFFR